MEILSKTWVEISKRNLIHNLEAFRSHIPSQVGMMAVVKSNAYGHGLVEVARIAALQKVTWFGVDNVDEALQLRRSGIKSAILILGYTPHHRLQDCVKQNISFVVYNRETVFSLRSLFARSPALQKKQARIHLKIETGTHRQGIHGLALQQLIKEIQKIPQIYIEGVSTHYANIEDTENHSYAERQLKEFHLALQILRAEGIDPPWKHTACSAAVILFPDTYFNLVRLGVAMYGLWPSENVRLLAQQKKRHLNLKPVLQWKTIIAQLKRVKKGSPIGYGLTERVSRDSILAVLPVGYWDGYDRGLSSCGTVLIRERLCKVLGRVFMNMCVVDVTDIPQQLRVEDAVTLLGTQKTVGVSAESIASKIGTINYEVVTRINPLLPRFVV